MSNFVYDNLPLPESKSDRGDLPEGVPTSQAIRAVDFNTVSQYLGDLRTVVGAGVIAPTSATVVTATGSTVARSLGDRFADHGATVYPRPALTRTYPILVQRQDADTVWVILGKYSNSTQKYVLISMETGLVTTTSSEGGAGELWRQGQVTDIALAYTWMKGAPTLGTTAAGGIHAITTQTSSATLLGPNGNGGLPYWQTLQKGDFLEWAGVSGPDISLGVFTSTTGATFDVLVDGVVNTTSTTKGATSGLIHTLNIRTTPGTHTVRVQHNDATSSVRIGVFGLHFYELKDAKEGLPYDTLRYGRDDTTYPAYVSNNGAAEYAIYNLTAGKWAGNYHGGETATTPAVWRLDGVPTSLVAGDVKVCRNLSLEQQTLIAWVATPGNTLSTLSRFDFHDGGLSFRCAMTGDVTARDFYTHMNKAAPTFTRVLFPTSLDATNIADSRYSGGYFNLGRINKCVQQHPSSGRTITSWWSLHDLEVNTRGPVTLFPDPAYNKLYYGLVADGSRRVTATAFESTWLFA